MTRPDPARPILVPVANPASAPPLLRYAADLASAGGTVDLLTVVGPEASEDDHAHAWEGLTAAEALAPELGVVVRGWVRTAEGPGTGVLEAIADGDPWLVLMGWRGTTEASDVFGRLIDHVVGRSSVPLAVIRLGLEPVDRLVVPISAEHLLPGGCGSLTLAAELTARIRASTEHPTTVLRSGSREHDLPASIQRLGDRIHHDPGRTHRAVEAFARPTDLIIAPVAPTASGLRAATTHLAWAAPDATLMVAVDVGPVPQESLVDAVHDAGSPPPTRQVPPRREQRIVVTIRLSDEQALETEAVEEILRGVGTVELVMSWWPDEDDRAHVGATVTVTSEGPNRALAAVMTAMHDAPALAGAEISYELDRGSPVAQTSAETASDR